MKMRRRKLLKRLYDLGSDVVVNYSVKINNDDVKLFNSLDDAKSYLFNYRDNNVIFSLELHRIEIYSL